MNRFGNNNITATLPIALFGSVDYYATMGACARVVIDDTLRYDKRQKSTHRFTVVDTHGIKNLTVPVSKPDGVKGPLRWSDIALSTHGMWWHVIEETLASAYGRTPFFEFYIDRLRRFFAPTTVDEYRDVATLCRESDRAIRAILNLDNEITYASQSPLPQSPAAPAPSKPAAQEEHCGEGVQPELRVPAQAGNAQGHPEEKAAPAIQPVEYYQVRADKFGFIPNLSILDLIFNMGPEAPLILHRMASR
ncbi:MAG: WbqC family protein [Bacteroidales bacterium]|nr:WbqC family protein [Bacteroidales bacterium]